ncbi:MAG: acetate--CoA ligase family protein [Microgenomates group bacterium]|jgi:acetyltransferase
MPRNLSALFSPKSICVIGASDDLKKIGAILLQNIIGSKFTGQIYPINPSSEMIQGLKCYKNVTDIPEVPDLAIIAIPAAKNLEVLTEIGEKGIKNVLTIAAGFREEGHEGLKLENDLIGIAKKYRINLLGPNCLGFINNFCPINATFGELVNTTGNSRFISQSGAIAASLFDWFKTTGIGFSEFITLGNKADLSENDILEYFETLETSPEQSKKIEGLSSNHPIGMYLESISDGPKFLEITKKISKTNPIYILKPGKTEAAASAMQSHTGAIAGADNVLEEVLKEAHIIRADTLEDFFDLSRAFSFENLPLGPKVAIITNAGGPGVLATDTISEAGLELVEFSDETKEKLAGVLPKSSNIHNPIDVLGDALSDRFSNAIEIVLQTSNADVLIVILTPQIMTQPKETAEAIGNLSKKYQKPIFCSFIGGGMLTEGKRVLNEYLVPSFRYPERAVAVVGDMWRFKKWQSEQEVVSINQTEPQINLSQIKEIIQKGVAENLPALSNDKANQISVLSNIPTPPSQIVSTPEDTASFATQNGYPVVLKVSSPNLLHKKDIQGVITNIQNKEEVSIAMENLKRNILKLDENIQNTTQIQIQKQINNGIEVIVGIKHDPTFGPILLFGSGGTYAELIADHNLSLLPIDLKKAKQIVEGSKISVILKGYRGEDPYNLDKLFEIIVQLCRLVESVSDISEMEINPLIVTHEGTWAVDTKVLLKNTQQTLKTPSKIQFQTAKVLSHDVLASTYHFLEFETEKPLLSKPGQYISVKINPTKINAYSIVSHPKPNRFNLLVDIKPGGLGSQYFEKIKVGDEITYLGPFGNFVLNMDDGAKRLLFLGTGSGVAPLRYQIESALKEHGSKMPMTLYFGLSYPYDLFWNDYFQKISLDYPNFKFKIAVWKPDNSWHGPAGFITQLVDQNITDASECAAYLCGNIQMIQDASKILLSRNIKKERIYTEKI